MFFKNVLIFPKAKFQLLLDNKTKKKLNGYFDFFSLVFFLAQYGQNHFPLDWTSNPRQLK